MSLSLKNESPPPDCSPGPLPEAYYLMQYKSYIQWCYCCLHYILKMCVCVLQVRDDDDECDSLCAAASVLLRFHLARSGGLSVSQITKETMFF